MGLLSFLLMLFLSQTQNSPRLPFQYIHHEIISPHSLIPGRLWYFNWVRRFNKKQTKSDKDPMLPPGGPCWLAEWAEHEVQERKELEWVPSNEGTLHLQNSDLWFMVCSLKLSWQARYVPKHQDGLIYTKTKGQKRNSQDPKNLKRRNPSLWG